MVLGGNLWGAAKTLASLFNTQSGQSCFLHGLPDSIQYTGGGIFDGYPAYCGGKTYYLGEVDACYKFDEDSWKPVRNYSKYC